MERIPTLVIAGTHSGVGKTSLTLALARALTRRGVKTQTFKVGPDFLDPTYLALASGRPCYNLDGWMAGRDYCRRLFARATADAECALVEGVMGLFDGANADDDGSTAEIARLLEAPVLLTVNVHGMGQSLAALVKGYATFRPDLRFLGIVANHCGSERHAALLSDALRAADLPPLLGAIPRRAFPELASRHLGLVTADPGRLPGDLLDALADALEKNMPLERLFPEAAAAKKSRSRPSETNQEDSGESPFKAAAKIEITKVVEKKLRIGVARDAAFHFYYPDLFDALERAGCELRFFSPLGDHRLPEALSGIYLGGGYPELHAARLAENGEMLAAIRAFAGSGKPLYAECGGLMYLSRGIETEGGFFPLAAVLPARTRMLAARKALGYAEATLTADSLWGRCGDLLRGHEFHYSELIDDPASDAAWTKVYALRHCRTDAVETEGYQNGAILASYLHLHYASRPAAIAHFLERCGGAP